MMERLAEESSPQSIVKYVTSSLIILVVITFLFYIGRLMWSRRRWYFMTKNVQGPLAFPLIGSLHKFVGNTGDIMGTIIREQALLPDLGKLWFGPNLLYLVSKPEHIEKILTSPDCINKDHHYKFLSYVMGEGLMTAKDKKWRRHRKIITPSFNQRILDSFMTVFAEQADILVDLLLKKAGQPNINLFSMLSRCTLDIICETAMGVQMNTQTTDNDFVTNLDNLMEITVLRIFRIWYQPEWLWQLFPLSKVYAKQIDKFHEFNSTVVKRKVDAYKRKMEDKKNGLIIDEDNYKFKPFLDLVLESSDFTEEELREEVDIFMIAGTDTTASAMTFFFTCVGIHLDVQEKVYEELINVLGPDRRIEPSDMNKLEYTERVIKETLRIFPVAAFFLRELSEDIDVGDAVLAKGASAFFGPVHIHRNKKYWDDPLKFDPDRFLPENVAKRHPCAYIPFSYGSRNCIGGRYAMMNMKSLISATIRKLKFVSEYKHVGDVGLKTNVVLRLKDGPKITVYPR